MAEFDSAQDLIEAAHRTREAGFKKIDAYSPFPIEGMAEAIGFHKNGVPLVVLIGGLVGIAVLDRNHGLPGECRWETISLLAIVHHCDVRDDHLVCWIVSRLRDASAEWAAHALPPSV
jgi:hypothetical protein